ncbi:ALKANE HYDROXYLASE MAH1-LIKE [Salix viminalis]|uniref:ALKANE HYDROXYLASE MAH1-LIKE n=1 Tax=Salix viminalis TaxID=40686 RepID=A0A9Q0NY46_SALVM|nr:ALKANE HYDROXYLASE MAH1-LIKE [Salix viminalis]
MASLGLLEIFLAVAALAIFCCTLGNKKKRLPTNWPLVGMLPDSIRNLHRPYERIAEIIQLSGGSFIYKSLWGPMFSRIFDILGDGIFNADSHEWKSQRKLAHSLLNHQQFQRFLVKSSWKKVETGLVPVLEHVAKQGSVVDLQDVFQRFTFDITSVLVTGFDPGCLSVEFPRVEFSEAMDDAEEAIFYRHIWPELFLKIQRWLGFGREQKLKEARRTLDRMVAEYISRKREELISKKTITVEDEDGVDLLTSYMSHPEILGLKTDDKFLRDTIVNFFLAGRDTTSSALTWFFWLVSQNPQVESRIREELKAFIPAEERENRRLFSTQELSNLVYLHGALCETLRLYPPVPFQHKEPLETDVLPTGHPVGPNMMVLFSVYVMGRTASIWGPDCLEFKPERWISESGKIKHEPSYKFLAFNAGPRTCLGKGVAFTQMKAVAAAIIHNYQVRVVEGHPVTPSSSIILHMKHGLKARLSRKWV